MTKRWNLLDRAIAAVAPGYGLNRIRNRYRFEMMSGGYNGASKSRDAVAGWSLPGGDADSEILGDLPTLRDRSSDLVRNNPIACGAINTKVTHVVGTGLKLHASIDRDYLGLSEEEAQAWEEAAEREFRMWANSQNADIERTLFFSDSQDLAFRMVLERGDHFVLLASAKRKGAIYDLTLQHIEADRVCNENNAADTETLTAGVKKTKSGEPHEYHVLESHPKTRYAKSAKWSKLPAFGKNTGRRITLHLHRKLRPGQTRGVPDLAPVIEVIKQLGRYTEAEVDAAVKTAVWALIVKTETGDGLAGLEFDQWKETRKEYYKDSPIKMDGTSSRAMGLFPDDDVYAFDPTRPNTALDPFIKALMNQIGMAIEIPAEVLMKSFQTSYSAARAAMIQLAAFVAGRRRWLADNLCQPVYEALLYEAVAKGRLNAPGFFTDPAIRAAYCGAEWVGDAMGQIDENKAVSAARERVEGGFSNNKIETAALTGKSYKKVHEQRQKEIKDTAQAKPQPSADDLDRTDAEEAMNDG